MDEKTSVAFLLYGGEVVAFFCLLFASVTRKSNLLRWIWLALAFLALGCQAELFKALAGIGNATGGGSDPSKLLGPVEAASFIAFVWAFVLVFFFPIEKRKLHNHEDKTPSGKTDVDKP